MHNNDRHMVLMDRARENEAAGRAEKIYST